MPSGGVWPALGFMLGGRMHSQETRGHLDLSPRSRSFAVRQSEDRGRRKAGSAVRPTEFVGGELRAAAWRVGWARQKGGQAGPKPFGGTPVEHFFGVCDERAATA